VAVGVQVPGGSSYTLNSVTVRLHDVSDANGTPFSLSVYDDGGGEPGNSIGLIGSGAGTWDGAQTYDAYTIDALSPIQLQAGASYWIVATSPGDDTCPFGWIDPAADPVGSVFNHVGERDSSDAGSSWASEDDGDFLQLEIDASPSDVAPVPSIDLWAVILLIMSIAAMAMVSRRRLKPADIS